jgi:hypothetical protein
MARIELETQLGDSLELLSPLQYEIAKFGCGHREAPPANGRFSFQVKAAIIGLRRKSCQEMGKEEKGFEKEAQGKGFAAYLALPTTNSLY